MTSTAPDVVALEIPLFEDGSAGWTILAAAVRDVAYDQDSQPEVLRAFEALVETPWLAALADDGFFGVLLGQVRASTMTPSGVARFAVSAHAFAARRHSSLELEFLAECAEKLLLADEPERAAAYAAKGVSQPPHGRPATRTRCYDVLSRCREGQGDWRGAVEAAERGLECAGRAGETEHEWSLSMTLAASFLQMGDYLRARAAATAAESVARREGLPLRIGRALGVRGNADLALGRPPLAREAFEEALSCAAGAGDSQAESNWAGNLGLVAASDGEFDTAEKYHRRALEISRRIGAVMSEQLDWSNLASTLWASGQHEASVDALTEALRLAVLRGDTSNEKNYRSTLRGSLVELRRNDRVRALDALDEDDAERSEERGSAAPLDVEPDIYDEDGRALEHAIGTLLNAGDLDGARSVVDTFVARHPADWRGFHFRGFVEKHSGDLRVAIESYRAAVALNPGALESHFALVNSFSVAGDLQTPLVSYRDAVTRHPHDGILRAALGHALGLAKDTDAALRELREACRLSPSVPPVRECLAITLATSASAMMRTSWDAAWARAEEACGELCAGIPPSGPRRTGCLLRAAWLLEGIAAASQAAQPPLFAAFGVRELVVLGHAAAMYESALERSPGNAGASSGLERVRGTFELAWSPELVEAGSLLLRAGQKAQALFLLVMACAKDPSCAEAKYELATLLARDARSDPKATDTAIQYLNDALRLDPSNEKFGALHRRLSRSETR